MENKKVVISDKNIEYLIKHSLIFKLKTNHSKSDTMLMVVVLYSNYISIGE